jgi:hypothetical protein
VALRAKRAKLPDFPNEEVEYGFLSAPLPYLTR